MKLTQLKILTALFLLTSTLSLGQLQNGSVSPDFTLTDINGTQHNLYNYLNQGKTVYIDFFACHCPTCWNYHNTHAVSNLYDQYGPNSSSNDVFVIAIEYDANNGLNELNGISGNTQGDWVSGSNYPIINPEGAERSTIISDYQVIYYPMVYAICPDKTVTLIGTQNTSTLYNHVASCAPLGLEQVNSNPEVSIYQNENQIIVELLNENLINKAKVEFVNLQGQIIESQISESSSMLFNLNKGVYLMRVLQNGEVLVNRKVLVY